MRKFFGLLLAIVLIIPVFVNADVTVTGKGVEVFANGIAIVIQEDVPEDGTSVTLEGFTATGTDAYIVWTEGETTKYVGVSDDTKVYGGSLAVSTPVDVASTSITMTGGTIAYLNGGNCGLDKTVEGTTLATASKVTGNVNISMTGGVVGDIYGGGKWNASVEGTVTINLSGVSLPNAYVVGGVHGNGFEGYIDVNAKTINSNAIVNRVSMTIDNSSAMAVIAGGGGHTRVNEATIVLGNKTGTNDTVIDYVFVGGINGYTGSSDITLNSDVKVTAEVTGTNRGYLNNGKVTINGSTVESIYTGATVGAFNSDGNNASAVLGKMEIVINDASGVKSAFISPSVNKRTNQDPHYYEVFIKNLSLTNNDEENAVDFKLGTYTASSKIEDLTNVANYIIPEDGTVSLNGNVTFTVDEGIALENAGTIENNATIVTNGSIDNELGKINTGVDGVTPVGEGISGNIPKTVLVGANQEFDGNKEENIEKGLVVEFNGVLGEHFTEEEGKVYVDEKLVDPENYTLTRGSIVVTFKSDYLKYLTSGNHVIKLVYDDGSFAETAFTTTNTNPKTSDPIVISAILALISMIGISFVATKALRRN